LQNVRAYAPASIGNIGPGFDVLGLAIQGLGDIVEVKKREAPGVTISKIVGQTDHLSKDPERNTSRVGVGK
jgi:homoserine kinase